jgi:tRNA(Arg) A34 adenosine deaminase TadA
MSGIQYPYLPEGKTLKYATADHPYMIEAANVRDTQAGDTLYPVGSVLVKDGKIIGRGGNGYNQGPGNVHICPRIVLDCQSGEGYDLCTLHDSPGHSEVMTLADARANGYDPAGADLYMYGHWWACEPCWKAMLKAGVRDVYVLDDAHERFSKENVYKKAMLTTLKSAYIAGPITNVEDFDTQAGFYEAIGEVCEGLGITARIPHRDNALNEDRDKGNSRGVYDWASNEAVVNDVVIAEVSQPSLGTGGELVEAHKAGTPIVLYSKKGSKVSRYVLGNPSVVYHVEYEDLEDAKRQIRNVLRLM